MLIAAKGKGIRGVSKFTENGCLNSEASDAHCSGKEKVQMKTTASDELKAQLCFQSKCHQPPVAPVAYLIKETVINVCKGGEEMMDVTVQFTL